MYLIIKIDLLTLEKPQKIKNCYLIDKLTQLKAKKKY